MLPVTPAGNPSAEAVRAFLERLAADAAWGPAVVSTLEGMAVARRTDE